MWNVGLPAESLHLEDWVEQSQLWARHLMSKVSTVVLCVGNLWSPKTATEHLISRVSQVIAICGGGWWVICGCFGGMEAM